MSTAYIYKYLFGGSGELGSKKAQLRAVIGEIGMFLKVVFC